MQGRRPSYDDGQQREERKRQGVITDLQASHPGGRRVAGARKEAWIGATGSQHPGEAVSCAQG